MNDLLYARAYITDERLGRRIGYGIRRFVLFDRGRQLVSLCDVTTATIVRIDRRVLEPVEIEIKPRWQRLARCLKSRVKNAKVWGHNVPVKRCLALAARMKAAA